MKSKIGLNVVLFILTIASTFIVGLTWGANYIFAEKIVSTDYFDPGFNLFFDSRVLALAVLYAFVLLLILVGHELGHYLVCKHYKLETTLPYFIPAPTLIGTLGAFIKIKSPIATKKQLFDIGIAGPLTGFLLSLPAIIAGVALSKSVNMMPRTETISLGEPLIFKIFVLVFFGKSGSNFDIILHPVAFAGWVGALVSALNLFPIGQLDGGHIVYAIFGNKSRKLLAFIIPIFIFMGLFLWVGWLFWVFVIMLLGLKHPMIASEEERINSFRLGLGLAALLIFVLCFIPDPVKGYDAITLLKQSWLWLK